jgi:hypothetical protein
MISDPSCRQYIVIIIIMLSLVHFYHCIVTFSVLLWPIHFQFQYIVVTSILLWPIHLHVQYIVVTSILLTIYLHVQYIVVTSILLWPAYCCDNIPLLQYIVATSILLWPIHLHVVYCCDQNIVVTIYLYFSILLWRAYCCDQYTFTFSVFLDKYCTTNSRGVTGRLRSIYYFCLPTGCPQVLQLNTSTQFQ